MSVASILQFLDGELARHGAEIVSVADLAALRAVEFASSTLASRTSTYFAQSPGSPH